MLLSSGGVSAGTVALTGDRSVESSLWCESSGARQNGPSPALQAPFPVQFEKRPVPFKRLYTQRLSFEIFF